MTDVEMGLHNIYVKKKQVSLWVVEEKVYCMNYRDTWLVWDWKDDRWILWESWALGIQLKIKYFCKLFCSPTDQYILVTCQWIIKSA